MVTGKEEGSKCGGGEKLRASQFGWACWCVEKAPDEGLNLRREAINLDVDVLFAPERNSRQPILLFNRRAGTRPVFGREYPGCSRERRPGDFASDGARCDSHLRVIPNALEFPRVASGLYIELVVQFSKPHRRWYRDATLAKGGEADVLLPLNLVRNGHWDIVRRKKIGSLANRFQAPLCGCRDVLTRGSDVRNVNRAGAAVEGSAYLNLLAYKLLGFLLVVQLVTHVAGLQHILAACFHYGSGER